MRTLKAAARLGFRTLEQRAEAVGDVLPKSTLVAVLSRDTLPREEVVAAFVRACGLDEDAVGRWLAVRRRIALGGRLDGLVLPVAPPPAPELGPALPPPAPEPDPALPPYASKSDPCAAAPPLDPVSPVSPAPVAVADLTAPAVHAGPVGTPAVSPWLVEFVPPAIWRGSWATRIGAATLFILVLLVTFAAVVESIRDWLLHP